MRIKRVVIFILFILMSVGITLNYSRVQALALSTVTSNVSSYGGRVYTADDSGNTALSNYPTFVNAQADGLINGRISKDTQNITLTFNGNMTTKGGETINSYHFDVLDRNGNTVATNTLGWTTVNGSSITVGGGIFGTNNKTQSFTVNLANLKDQMPLYAAVVFKTNEDGAGLNKYAFAQFKKNTLTPKITTDPITQATEVIEGTGTAGSDITYDGYSGDPVTVGADGKFKMELSKGALSGKTSITLIESDDMGDSGTVTSAVTNPITIEAEKTSIDLSSSDESKLESMSDTDFISWVKDQAVLSGKNVFGNSDGITIKTDSTGLAAALKKVADNGSMTIDFYATDGSSKSETKTITLVKPGTVKFSAVSDSISFGTHPVPTAEAIYGPTTAWNVAISDTRSTGSKWYLYATATNLVSGSHTLPGNLVYRSASGQSSNLTKSTLIDQGERDSNSGTTVTDGWTTDPTDKSKAGIFLDTQPGVYATSDTQYSGTINWTLSDVPEP
ncbi:hypothetical protein D1831_06880 [Lactiplantibacillus garii]|uniref:Cell surface protein n=1 Tax=Lactiplantibacillus garii TaxID=2306423 RepID=A0A3R8J7E7_9LACO|nr:hypothetical protein [Lactiplantibacillus garii]RRK10579.1 hypothetical protein D1831_06880 [Lactiplantibacillus garii]